MKHLLMLFVVTAFSVAAVQAAEECCKAKAAACCDAKAKALKAAKANSSTKGAQMLVRR